MGRSRRQQRAYMADEVEPQESSAQESSAAPEESSAAGEDSAEESDAHMAEQSEDPETAKLEAEADAPADGGGMGSMKDMADQHHAVDENRDDVVKEETKTQAEGWDNFSSDLVAGDEGDKKAVEEKFFKKTKVNCRGRIHNFCDGMEIAADLMLTDALLNKATRAKVLDARQKLLYALWRFRDTADCEDDFDQDEFHSEMRVLAVIQRKLMSLDIKVDTIADGAESSSDTEGDGEKDNLQKLKFARQTLRYAMGKGSIPAA